jgi:hypothetical protein
MQQGTDTEVTPPVAKMHDHKTGGTGYGLWTRRICIAAALMRDTGCGGHSPDRHLQRLHEPRHPGALAGALTTPDDPQIAAIASVILEVAPDILLINEFDYAEGSAALFVETYLDGAYPYAFEAPSNTGVPTGLDLNGDGTTGTPEGDFPTPTMRKGFGLFEGQYGMAVLSRYPIDTDNLAHLPDLPLGRHARCAPARPKRAKASIPTISSTSCTCRPNPTGTCRSKRRTAPSTCWQATRRRPCSTGPRIATAPATPTKSASGPITCRARVTSTTTPGAQAACPTGRISSSRAT